MVGGIDAHMFRLSLAVGGDVVLRVTLPGGHDDVAYQARVLDVLSTTAVPAPRVIAHATAVGPAGHRVLLQTLLPGDPTIPLEPTDAWLSEIVAAIVALQSVPVAAWMADRVRVRWEALDAPDTGELSPADTQLLNSLRARRDATPLTRVFGHDDLWVGNTLRDGHRVVGIVDWGHAGVVSAARDVTYCAVDTSLCYGLDVGDRLVDVFSRQVFVDPEEMLVWSARCVFGSRYFPEWLPGWNGLGVPVRHEQAERRRTELLDRTLARLG
jgi:aminoglycoside phosphotransferase